jgi:archaemetzincin
MTTVQLLRLGTVAPEAAEAVTHAIQRELGWDAVLLAEIVDPEFALDERRGQYHSTLLLHHLEQHFDARSGPLLGITPHDLFIPILTFVFGEALLRGPAAVVSLHRLRPEFYGLPPDPELLLQRLGTEAIHELGHTRGLLHCGDYACAMHASHAADEIDVKGPGLCAACLSMFRPEHHPRRRLH